MKKEYIIIGIVVFSTIFIVSPFVYKLITGNYPSGFPLGNKQNAFETAQIQIIKESPIKVDWTRLNSPPGGGYWTISISQSNPNTVLIASRDFNILKTTNAGSSWTLLGEKLFGAHIFSNMIIHPSDANKIIISNGAVYYTEDGGIVWYAVDIKQIGSGKTEGVTALALANNNPNIVYASQGNEFYQSKDFGKNWKKLSEIEGSTIRGIAVAEDEIYIMNSGSGLWKSTDNGNTFKKVDEVSGVFTYNYLFHDKTNGDLYFATAGGLYKYSGGAWKKIPQFDSQIQPLVVSASGDIVYVTTTDKSIYKSLDGGNSWIRILTVNDIQSHHGYNFPIAIHPYFPDTVYVATDNRILKSIDGGSTWQEIGGDVKDDSLFVMAYAKDTKTIWVGAYWTRGLFKTADEGKNWNFIESWRSAEPHDHYPMSIIVNPQDSRKVYVSGAAGVKITEDNGETWEPVAKGTSLYDRHIHGLGVDKENPDILYAGTAPGWGQGYQTSKIFRTTDLGKTWYDLPSFPSKEENNVYAFDVKGDTIYASINQHERDDVHAPHTNAQGVLRSLDGGKTWQDVSGNLPHKNVFPIAVHPDNSSIVYAGLGHTEEVGAELVTKGDQGLFRSVQSGDKWKRVEGLPEIQPSRIRFNPSDSNIIFVTFGEHICGACAAEVDKDENKYPNGAGVYGTMDGGDTWYNLVSEGTFTKRQMAVMDFVFADNSTIYAITDDGLFKGRIQIKVKE